MTARGEQGSSPLERAGWRATGVSVDDGLPLKDPRIRRAVDLLKQERPVSVGEIASMLNLSSSRFRHLFKKELHVSPAHFRKLARLERARSLIEGTFLRVKEVAALSGWNDVSHFVRDYKTRYGHTPSQTRMGGEPRR